MDYHNLLLTDLSVSTLALYHQQSNHGDPFEMEPPISSLRPNHITVLCFTQVFSSVQFSCSVVSDCLQAMDCSTPGFPVLHYFLEFVQTHAHWVSDATQASCPLSSPSPPAFNFSQHQSVFQWVGSLHQVAKVLELQLQHQSFQWLFRLGFI